MCNPTNAVSNEGAPAAVEMEHDVPHWTESANDWFQRCDTVQHIRAEPQDPVSAAQSFVRGETTGISFLDEALASGGGDASNNNKGSKSSMLEISGNPSHMTTETLLSLAARFVVATRPSKFGSPAAAQRSSSSSPPQVVLIDSLHNVSIERLVSLVRGMLLLDSSTNDDDAAETTAVVLNPAVLDLELNDCLTRIHIVLVHDTTSTVAALEALKQQQHHVSNSIKMILWDGFLATSPDATARMEVLRQLGRLWRERVSIDDDESSILIALASNRPRLENKHVTSRIRLLLLEQQLGNTGAGEQRYRATVRSNLSDFTIGASGVLSL